MIGSEAISEVMTLLNVPLSRRSLFAALGWPTLFVILFYSLALHLYLGLGGWPPSIGVQPETLLFAVHAGVTGAFFWGGMIALPFIVAVAFLCARQKKSSSSNLLVGVCFRIRSCFLGDAVCAKWFHKLVVGLTHATFCGRFGICWRESWSRDPLP